MKKYKPISAKDVAAAMIQGSKNEQAGCTIFGYDDIKRLSEQFNLHQHPE